MYSFYSFTILALHGSEWSAPRYGRALPPGGRLRGVVVSVLATGPKGCGFEPGQGWIFKGDKNPQHVFLLGGK
jgi:hypothetical protein